jgi:hypothetical protein
MATHMKLLVNVRTGQVNVEAVNIDGDVSTPGSYKETLDPKNYKEGSAVDLNRMHDHSPRHLGVLLHTDPSVGCVYWIGGQRVEVC